ncbi:MAG: four helix bundle protein [Bacteroidia bacterium]|nr:four helix bundle protein [Bacteroidia bacterium]
MNKKSILKEKSLAYAIGIVRLNQFIQDEKNEFVMSRQLLRSGTSVGANIREAGNAESNNDFIHKLGIAQKECDESLYWLELLMLTGYISDEKFKEISAEAHQILKMIKSAILTIKQKTHHS